MTRQFKEILKIVAIVLPWLLSGGYAAKQYASRDPWSYRVIQRVMFTKTPDASSLPLPSQVEPVLLLEDRMTGDRQARIVNMEFWLSVEPGDKLTKKEIADGQD